MLPGWFLVLTAAACLVGVLGLGWTVFFTGDDAQPAGATPSATATATATAAPSPTPSPTEDDSPSPEPQVSREDIKVSVLNASRTVGLAGKVATRARKAGWTVGGVGNWRYGAAENAVYFPSGRKAEARLLADDLGIDRVLRRTAEMRSNRLTVILLRLP